MNTETDCRTEDGTTTGLIDALISIARIVAKRDLSADAVQEALKDLRSDEDVDALLHPAAGRELTYVPGTDEMTFHISDDNGGTLCGAKMGIEITKWPARTCDRCYEVLEEQSRVKPDVVDYRTEQE